MGLQRLTVGGMHVDGRAVAVLVADMPQATRLAAQTIQTWWPEIEAFLRLSQPRQLRTPYRPARRRQERGVTAISEGNAPSAAESPWEPNLACLDIVNEL